MLDYCMVIADGLSRTLIRPFGSDLDSEHFDLILLTIGLNLSRLGYWSGVEVAVVHTRRLA